MSQENRFGEYISKLRTAKGISQEQLSDGLCDFSLLSRFERGEREAEKLLQNRFLTRLGVVPENYENFLYYKEYCRWEKRQGIIHNILDEQIEEAKRRLEEYHQEYDMTYALEKQFYLAMQAQIRRCEGADKEELADLFEQALELTVPDVNTKSFRTRVLSLEELNLLLEYRYCRPQGISLQFYETLLDYIEKMEQTTLAMAKVYPKAVYYYYVTWKGMEEFTINSAARMMELCDKAIELLRNANRMFYLWELFCMKEELAVKLPEGIYQPAEYAATVEECRNWKETLEEIYQDYNVSIAMYEFCYLYVESEYYCIGDVIRIRRKMLGLSQEKLCEGICSGRTVSRLERNLSKPQKEIVQQLFDRLNLSTELCRTELVTDSQEAIEKYRELKDAGNNRNYIKVESLINEIKQLISMDNSSNKQSLMRDEISNDISQGKYTKKEQIEKLKEILGYTVPYETVIATDEMYLTNIEIGCLQNIMVIANWSFPEMQECVDVLTNIYSYLKYPAYYTRMYEFVMLSVANKLGDGARYEQSNKIMIEIIEMSLKNRRIKAIDILLYSIFWNNMKNEYRCLNGYEKEIHTLQRCLQLCDLSRNKMNKFFFSEKLKQLRIENHP